MFVWILQIINTNIIVACRKYVRSVDPAFRGHQAAVAAALDTARTRVESGAMPSADVLRLVDLSDQVEQGDFDTRVALPQRFTETLVAQLDDAEYLQFAKRVRFLFSYISS